MGMKRLIRRHPASPFSLGAHLYAFIGGKVPRQEHFNFVLSNGKMKCIVIQEREYPVLCQETALNYDDGIAWTLWPFIQILMWFCCDFCGDICVTQILSDDILMCQPFPETQCSMPSNPLVEWAGELPSSLSNCTCTNPLPGVDNIL